MPVTAKLSRNFYDRLGDDIANELVDWFNAADDTYRTQLREQNELNWQRFQAAMDAARGTPAEPVPLHIRNAPTKLMKDLGYHEGYQYAHSDAAAYIPQEYLPEKLRGTEFYKPGPFGFEKEIAKRLQWWAALREKSAGRGSEEPAD